MGFMRKLLVLFVGLASFSLGVWPVGVICLAYVILSSRPRFRTSTAGPRRLPRFHWRYAIALTFLGFAALAAGSGGTYSPLAFAAVGIVALVSPVVTSRRLSHVVPVEGSFLLRSRYFPLRWSALAEVVPTYDEPPRSLASYSGELLIFTQTGRIFAAERCLALGAKRAERKILRDFRDSSSQKSMAGCLLPLDAETSAAILGHDLKGVKSVADDLVGSAPGLAGIISLRSVRGRVAEFSVDLPSSDGGQSVLPRPSVEAPGEPLLWEVLDALGKNVEWPSPDGLSSVMESVRATKGEHIGERVGSMDSEGAKVRVTSLGGESAELSRVQLRAIVSIYS